MASGSHSIKTRPWLRKSARILIVIAVMSVNACGGLPRGYSRPDSHVIPPNPKGHIASITGGVMREHRGQSGFFPLEEGQDSLVARLALVDAAQTSLDIQYYIWHQDGTGLLLLNRILQAADRGVRVRLLLDDVGGIPRDSVLLALATHPNIHIRIFNPTSQRTLYILSLFVEFERINGRMHNKSLTADSQVTIIGGRNIGDEYFEYHEQLDFGDLDVLAIGPVVNEVNVAFDLFWNSKYSVPIIVAAKRKVKPDALAQLRPDLERAVKGNESVYMKNLNTSRLNRVLKTECTLPFNWGVAHALYDEPGKVDLEKANTRRLMSLLEPAMNNSRYELVIVSSYFIPGKHGVRFLQALRKKGVSVRVITNSATATDVFPVHASYARYRIPLLRAGVELYEIKSDAPVWSKRDAARRRYRETGIGGRSRSSLHAKAFIIDRKHIFIGSLNLDPRSVDINTEIGLLIHSESLARDAVRRFDARLPVSAFRLELVRFDPESSDMGERIEWITWEDGKEVRYRSEPHVNFIHRIVMWFLSLPPFESQL